MLLKTAQPYPKSVQDFYHDRAMLHELMVDVASEGPQAKQTLILLTKIFETDAKSVVFFAKMGLLSNLLMKYEKQDDPLELLKAAEASQHWTALISKSQQFSAEKARLQETLATVKLHPEVKK